MDLLADTKKPMPLFWPICCCMETQRIFVVQSSFYKTLFLFPLGSPGLNWALIKSRAWFTLRPASQKPVSLNGVPGRALITFQEAIIQTWHKATLRGFKTSLHIKMQNRQFCTSKSIFPYLSSVINIYEETCTNWVCLFFVELIFLMIDRQREKLHVSVLLYVVPQIT